MPPARAVLLRSPLAGLLLGLLVFAGGLALAHAWLPEWQTGGLRDQAYYAARFQALAGRLGVQPAAGRPRVHLAVPEDANGANPAGGREPGSAPGLGASAQVRVWQRAAWPAAGGQTQNLIVTFAPDGRVREVSWLPGPLGSFFSGMSAAIAPPGRAPQLARRAAPLLLGPGESLGPPRAAGSDATQGVETLRDVRGTREPEHLRILALGHTIRVLRRPGNAAEAAAPFLGVAPLLLGLARLLFWLAVVVLFFVLLTQRRIDVVNGGLLAALTLLATAVGGLLSHPYRERLIETLSEALLLALWVLVVWSAGESLLRSVAPRLATGMDALRTGRLGPRGGAAVLRGWAVGAGVAGLRLALAALAVALPGAWPRGATVEPDPVLGGEQLLQAVAVPGLLAVALGLALRFLPARWAPWAAALAGALILKPLPLHPFSLQLAASLALTAPLVWLGARAGLAALLAATVVSTLLPELAFAARHPAWFPVFLPFGALLVGLFLAAGLRGLRRPREIESAPPAAPAFMKRLDAERRVRYEMDLLARMQLGLQPRHLPALPGWEIAATSVLATEVGGDLYDFAEDDAGRLWLAAGDVAGHGYSCAIAQAMTLAALASLIAAERTPAEVLGRLDRVLRRGGALRHFTSLALLRLDPATGEALLANAGHPFPLHAANGEVREVDLPGLPLGQGPSRAYRDLHLHLPPGALLVFGSDGLYEAAGSDGLPYGFEAPREVLRRAGRRPATSVLEALLAGWRDHLAGAAPADDTTVLVLKRAAAHLPS